MKLYSLSHGVFNNDNSSFTACSITWTSLQMAQVHFCNNIIIRSCQSATCCNHDFAHQAFAIKGMLMVELLIEIQAIL